MATIKEVELDDGDMLRVRRKGRLNGHFLPIAADMMAVKLFQVIPELSSSALRMLCGILKERDEDHVRYVEVSPENSRDLRSLELNGIVLRLTAAQYSRRKGFTTVLLSPEYIRTRDTKILELWSRCTNAGLSTEQEEHSQ